MPNANDPFRTTEHASIAATPGPDTTTDHSPGSPPASDVTAGNMPGQSTEPKGKLRETALGSISVPGYEIEAVLGRGGMGVVYKARQIKANRVVALKMILGAGIASPAEIARFRTEAEAIASINHANIVQIYEVGEHAGMPYFSLEYCTNKTLKDKLVGDPIPGRDAAALVEKLAWGIAAAHAKGIIHRDLKPANVLLAEDGTPKVADFGLAKRFDDDSSQTKTGAIVGTPSYMAPEQASGEIKTLGPSCDVYALGAILYECVAGRPPFKGATALETLEQVRGQEPVSPRLLQPAVPRDLETICLKCLRKEEAKRYESARALADDLNRFLAGKPIVARSVSRIERAVKWVKRNPAVTGAAAAVVLALAVGTTVSYLKYLDAAQQRSIAEDREKEARNEADKARRARDFLVRILRISETDTLGGNITARQILAVAEKRIPAEFADQPELRAELEKAIGEVKRGIARQVPQAMILEVSGTVRLQSAAGEQKTAALQALVNLDDRLTLSANAQVRLVFLADFHKERLKPGREVTIDSGGCEPADAVLERDDSILMTFVPISKRTFYKGWDGQKKGVKTEIKEDFEIAVHDVTQGQWQAVMGNNPSHFSRKGDGRNSLLDISDEELKLFPVETVSWVDAQEFIKRLNEKERGRGYLYRLPTEAEWECACRDGATSEKECSFYFYFDRPTNELSPEQANYNGNLPFGTAPKGTYLQRTTRVGAYPSNRLGLCDMHGNVWQWCADGAVGVESRASRGGGWFDSGAACQAGYRDFLPSTIRFNFRGFRLARVPVR
jgi:serine/threonine protein kinase/formylglycine-generating enzyme required for sulfatase activity